MVGIHREHKGFFWLGMFIGALLGGAIAAFLVSDPGRKAYAELESAARQARSRMNGRPGPDGPQASPADGTATPESEENVEGSA